MTNLNEWDTTKFDNILKRLETLCTKELQWGFFPNSVYPESHSNRAAAGQYVAQVAYWNEYGSLLAPPRPFFQSHIHRLFPISKKDSGWNIQPYLKNIYDRTIKGTQHAQAVRDLGVYLVKDLQDKIEMYGMDSDDINPNNSPKWAAEKGKDDPLMHTGVMKNSVEYKVVRKRG